MAAPVPDLVLPRVIGAVVGQAQPLTAGERAYFTRYGGAAAHAVYGGSALLVVDTTSPLRHLHAPDECQRGAGHRVRHLGMRFDPTPEPPLLVGLAALRPVRRRWPSDGAAPQRERGGAAGAAPRGGSTPVATG